MHSLILGLSVIKFLLLLLALVIFAVLLFFSAFFIEVNILGILTKCTKCGSPDTEEDATKTGMDGRTLHIFVCKKCSHRFEVCLSPNPAPPDTMSFY